MLIDEKDEATIKSKNLESGLSVGQLVSAAWASASTFRNLINVVAPMEQELIFLHKNTGMLINPSNWESFRCIDRHQKRI